MSAHLCALQGLSTIVSATDHLLRRWAFAATLLGATAAGLAPRAAAQASNVVYGYGCHAPAPMTLSATPPPEINPCTDVSFTVHNLPEFVPGSGIYLSTLLAGFGPVPGGIDLTNILTTVPGCNVWFAAPALDLGGQLTFAPTATWVYRFCNTTFTPGDVTAWQSVALFDGSFPLPNGESGGFLVSNGVRCTTDTY